MWAFRPHLDAFLQFQTLILFSFLYLISWSKMSTSTSRYEKVSNTTAKDRAKQGNSDTGENVESVDCFVPPRTRKFDLFMVVKNQLMVSFAVTYVQ